MTASKLLLPPLLLDKLKTKLMLVAFVFGSVQFGRGTIRKALTATVPVEPQLSDVHDKHHEEPDAQHVPGGAVVVAVNLEEVVDVEEVDVVLVVAVVVVV